MTNFQNSLELPLRFAAAAQLVIAILNLWLNRMLGWREELTRMPLLLREVHQVHAWFISVTLGIFAAITWRFAPEFVAGTNPVCRWLAAGIGIFWGFRTVLQIAYYSASHWRGRPARTCIHITLLLMYGGFGLVYLLAAMR
jgi:hypothetical protein